MAVVGAAHVDGIARQWSLQQSRSREEAADLLKLVQMQVPQDISLQQLRYYLSIGVHSDAVTMANSSVHIASREYASSISRQHLKNKRGR